MNVDVIGRIRPPIRAEGKENLVVEGQRVAAQTTGPFLNFSTLHRKDSSNYDVFKHSVENLLELYLAGFNVCLFVMGESEAGKTYTIAGESTNKSGIVPMVFDYLFTKLNEERYMSDTKVRRQNPTVSLEMMEVYNELIKDLLKVPGGGSAAYLELTDSAEKGVHAKNGSHILLRDANDANSIFRQGLARRTEASTDFGPAQNNAATVIHIDLQMIVGDNPHANKSRFTVVELPGLEKLSDDPTQLRQKEGPVLSKGLISLNSVVTSLASNPYPDRVINYSDSKLTQLLKDELGGNCKTRALLCLKPQTDPHILSSILTFCTRVSQVKNYPILNDSYAQNLITQYRARILDLQQQSGVGPVPMSKVTNLNDVKDTIRELETENLRLKDENERLRTRLENMQTKFGSLANTKTDLSQQLLMTEEEKLKVSQSLVEMQIENNKIREDAEASKFELTNKILMLENSLMEAENERDKHIKNVKNTKERLLEMEKDRKDLADEYIVLKTNYLALVKEHGTETKRNEELCIELLNLVNAKASLMRQVKALADDEDATLSHPIGDPDAEVSRVKALVVKNSSGKVKADEIVGAQDDRAGVEKALFANKKRFDRDMERIKREQEKEQERMESKIGSVTKDLHEARNLARDRQRRLAELNAALIVTRGEKEQLEVQVNRLQHKVKDLGEDYRGRLIKYVEDIAEYVDKAQGPTPQQALHLRDYSDNMIRDITRSHKEREEQLSLAAQQFRELRKSTMHKYEEILVAYRALRLLCEEKGISEVEMGPDEEGIKLSDAEIESSHMREISKLKTDINRLKQINDQLRNKYGAFEDTTRSTKEKGGDRPPESWQALRKQLREFSLNTQRQLEDERARLITENSILKEQLQESQDYIDHHLARYKAEIVKLRKMLGYEDDDGNVNAMPSDRTFKKGRRK